MGIFNFDNCELEAVDKYNIFILHSKKNNDLSASDRVDFLSLFLKFTTSIQDK